MSFIRCWPFHDGWLSGVHCGNALNTRKPLFVIFQPDSPRTLFSRTPSFPSSLSLSPSLFPSFSLLPLFPLLFSLPLPFPPSPSLFPLDSLLPSLCDPFPPLSLPLSLSLLSLSPFFRDRHRVGQALGTPTAIQTSSSHSGNRRARPRPGKAACQLYFSLSLESLDCQ